MGKPAKVGGDARFWTLVAAASIFASTGMWGQNPGSLPTWIGTVATALLVVAAVAHWVSRP